MALQALDSHEAASQCLARAGEMLASVPSSIVPGSGEEAKHQSLLEFWLKSMAALEAQFKELSVSHETGLT